MAVTLAAVLVVSWIFLAVQAMRLPAANRRIAELETESLRLDTLQGRLLDLQLRYDQMTRMLGASPADTSGGPPNGTSR